MHGAGKPRHSAVLVTVDANEHRKLTAAVDLAYSSPLVYRYG